jgi:hypothetical protein
MVLVLLAAALTLLMPAGATAQKKAPSAKAQVKREFRLLVKETRLTPKRYVKARQKAKLVRTAKKARKQALKRPCRAVKTLRKYNRRLKRVRGPRRGDQGESASPRGQLRAQLLTLNAAIKQLPRARRCGGGRRAKVAETSTQVLESNERVLRMRVQFPPVQFVSRQERGEDFIEPTMEGMGSGGQLGEPGLPAKTSFFGIPQGADVDVDFGNVRGYTVDNVNVYPKQPSPVDISLPAGAPPAETFLQPPFQIDREAYGENRRFPAQPSEGGDMGVMRDVRVGGVDAAGGQYNPRTDRLRVFTSIDVTVNFTGDNRGVFAPSTMFSPWNQAFQNAYGGLVNFDTVRARLDRISPVFCGEELLIVTSSELRPAANTLEAQREAQGFSTSVREVGPGSGQIGTTNTQIRDFIRGRLNGSCLIKPSYVILFGNTAHVPTFLVPCSPGGNPDECNIASDLDYSLNGIGTDLFADVQLGRLPAPNLDAANALVTKLNTYATTNPAPPGDDFLDHGTVTGYFQPPLICVLNEGATGTPNCNGDAPPVTGHWEIDYPANTDTRGFTITAERIRRGMTQDGYTVDRLFTTDDEDVIPLNYWNGTPIPDHLRRPTESWDANTTDFLNSYNEGRFVILHRDHGWPDGWAEPTLHSGHVPLFTNGSQQPVVFGINCSSAAFDDPAHPSFVELQVLRPDGGAIAGFGDTRVSPSFPNNHMALGFFDAMFPLTVADFGSDPGTRRLGDILVLGKQYMASQEGFEWHGAGDTYVEHYLYHLLGDPTMQMWAAPPVRFDPNRFRGIVKQIREYPFPITDPDPPPYWVQVELGGELAEGTMVTVFRNGNEAIGRGFIQNGVANILTDEDFDNHDDISFTLQQDGALPAGEPVENRAPREQTSLTMQVNGSPAQTGGGSFSGSLTPALADKTIRVRYTPDDPTNPTGTVEHTVTTDARGGWSDQVAFIYNQNNNQNNDWSAQAFFDGDSVYAPSQSNVVTFQVGD